MKYFIGEEVMYQGDKYAITIARPSEPYQYRLVRSTPDGAQVVWAQGQELQKVESYRRPRNDTQQVRGSRPAR